MQPVINQTDKIKKGDILVFACVRNERIRLPYFLQHHRQLGVSHFLIVDNGSSDGTSEFLQDQIDVSLWSAKSSYRKSRFGMDWMNALLARYGHGHWCLTVDADECLMIPHHDKRSLRDLTQWLERQSKDHFSAMMLDLYGAAALSDVSYEAGDAITDALPFYDAYNYSWERSDKYKDIQIKGGPRARVLCGGDLDVAPHLHKTPLVFWNWRYAYVSSTHVVLPNRLNDGFDARLQMPTGVLLHSKLLPELSNKAADLKVRAEYHHNPDAYAGYYDVIAQSPVFFNPNSRKFSSWEGLEKDDLISRGAWL